MSISPVTPPSGLSQLTSFGIDNPSVDNSGPLGGAGPGGKNPFLPSAGGTPLKLITPTDKPYGDNTKATTPNNAGSPERKTIVAQKAPNAQKPTTAAGDPSITNLPALIQQIDPQGAAQVLKGMMSAMALVTSTMASNSPTSQNNNITDGLTGALAILADNFSYGQVVEAFNIALRYGGFSQINPLYQGIVTNALLSLIEDAIKYGENNIPIPVVPPIVYGTDVPSPLTIIVPDLYVQQFYTSDEDPYPGYIQWLGPNGDYVYTLRLPSQPPFSTLQDQVVYISQQEIVATLTPFIPNYTLTASIINLAMAEQATNVQNNHTEGTIGSGSSSNLLSLLPQILGILGTSINLVQSAHLPFSVINQSSVTQSLEKFSKNIAMLKMMKLQSASAFQLPSALSSLGSVASLSNALSSAGISILGLSSVIGNLDSVSGILSSLASTSLGSSIPVSSLVVSTSSSSNVTAASILSALTASGASNTDVGYTKNLLNDINVS